MNTPRKILVIQTAFLGDAILATSLLESLKKNYPKAELHFLTSQMATNLFERHPYLQKHWVWIKNKDKYRHLWELWKALKQEKFDLIINCQRYFTTGVLTLLLQPKVSVGFNKNPLSMFFTHRVAHTIQEGVHETERNQQLLAALGMEDNPSMPVLYPNNKTLLEIDSLVRVQQYITISPGSVWFSKTVPIEKWIELLKRVSPTTTIYLLGGAKEEALAEALKAKFYIYNSKAKLVNLCGKLSLLASAALMKGAKMNFTNDSAPMHLASAVGAPVTALFCSTSPVFGFGPLGVKSFILEVENLPCKPCGMVGKKECPEGHFNCAYKLDMSKLSLH